MILSYPSGYHALPVTRYTGLASCAHLECPMPPSYSTDLRHRIVWLSVAHNASPTAISRLLHVSSRTVTRYVELFNRTDDVLPRDRCNGPHRLLGHHEQLILLRLTLESPGIYLYEVQRELNDHGVDVSTSTICGTLIYMGCSRQRIQRIALQRSDECRARFMAEISMYDPGGGRTRSRAPKIADSAFC